MIRQRIRCSTPFAHFYKWRLGHGERCPWCRLAVRFPIVQRVIPYSEQECL